MSCFVYYICDPGKDFNSGDDLTTLRMGSSGERFLRVDDDHTVLVQDNANIEERFQHDSVAETASRALFRRVPARRQAAQLTRQQVPSWQGDRPHWKPWYLEF